MDWTLCSRRNDGYGCSCAKSLVFNLEYFSIFNIYKLLTIIADLSLSIFDRDFKKITSKISSTKTSGKLIFELPAIDNLRILQCYLERFGFYETDLMQCLDSFMAKKCRYNRVLRTYTWNTTHFKSLKVSDFDFYLFQMNPGDDLP